MKERGQSTHSQGGTGENTPFAKQSRKKERDNGHDRQGTTKIICDKYQDDLNILQDLKILIFEDAVKTVIVFVSTQ